MLRCLPQQRWSATRRDWMRVEAAVLVVPMPSPSAASAARALTFCSVPWRGACSRGLSRERGNPLSATTGCLEEEGKTSGRPTCYTCKLYTAWLKFVAAGAPEAAAQLCGVASILLPVCSASSLLPVGER